MRRTLALTVVTIAMAGTLAACSSGEEPMVGGMTECTDEIINAAAEEFAVSLSADNAWYPNAVQCADGWAVASGMIGLADPPADGPMGAPQTIIFEQEGQFWIPKQAQDVCGTIDGDTYPSDAQVPEALFLAGCLSG